MTYSPDGPTQNIAVFEIGVVVRKLHKLCDRICLKNQRELVTCWWPACYCGGHVQEDLECLLHLQHGYHRRRKIVWADFSFRQAFSRYIKFHLLGSVPEIIALVGSCSGQEVLNDSHTNVVTHALQLPIHIVDILVILGKRYVYTVYHCTIGQTRWWQGSLKVPKMEFFIKLIFEVWVFL